MKGKLMGITIFFAAVIIVITACFFFSNRQASPQDMQAGQIVAANEIEQLSRMGKTEEAAKKAAQLQQTIREEVKREGWNGQIAVICGISLIFLCSVFSYVYFAILRPFEKMKLFAEKIAQGNLDIPLDYERSNYFGEFTWAFDSMRREITKARSCEREAVENNKTVIATLSHDIKTPISSIRAYAEGLEANLDGTHEKRAKYLSVIMRKCDEVSRLTNDLFLHSLSDLDKLKINLETLELSGLIEETAGELAAEQNDVCFVKPGFTVWVDADRNRLIQVMENLINNARKYAKTEIEISMSCKGDIAEIHFRDYGDGIPDEDMPFIFDKFYRGKNCSGEQGSGLGLYIVKYVTEKMGGKVLLHNYRDGLEAVVQLPVKEDRS
ncbi:sensor histidine kinase [bacterium D16-51]|nr:sensor histidine kinase [bacterium D16-59]RKI59116.1 sensor histidine kinase [bacterium D16-51]